MKTKIAIRNKRANFDYELSDRYIAGIALYGSEIKSIRLGKVGLTESFCQFENGELWVRNMQISTYKFGTFYNHEAKRDRKLLLTKRELKKLERATKETSFTIVPTFLFINDKGLAKLEVALARGKKNYDKRETLKKSDAKREIARAFKH